MSCEDHSLEDAINVWNTRIPPKVKSLKFTNNGYQCLVGHETAHVGYVGRHYSTTRMGVGGMFRSISTITIVNSKPFDRTRAKRSAQATLDDMALSLLSFPKARATQKGDT
ncbi:hypothetical protein [Vibrio hannami]|uniref:hypothetical protein n=1 Tax=Vibrio hannami TaxID=2717094 RepID=UPI003BAF92F5